MLPLFFTELDNGLQVLVQEDHTLPIVCSTIWYKAGARNETAGQTGVSHFLEHLMFKGTRRFPKGAIDSVTLVNGGHDNAFTSYDYTGYYFAFAADRWEKALDIEADRMRNILLDDGEFLAEKQVVMEEWRMGEDNPWEYLRKHVTALSYRRHPYRNPIIGWKEDVEGLAKDDVAAYYHAHYSPDNAVVVIVGDVDSQRTADLVEKKFGRVKRVGGRTSTPSPEVPPDGVARFTADRSGHVPRVIAAFHGPSVMQDDIHAVNLLHYILSEGKTSRLYRRLVEKDQLASTFSFHFEDMRDPALITMGAELREGVSFDALEGALFDEIEKVRGGGVADSELARAKRQLRADLVFEREDVGTLAMNLGSYQCIHSHQFYTGYMDAVDLVGLDSVQAAASKYLNPGRCVVGRLTTGIPRAASIAPGEPHQAEEGIPEDGFPPLLQAYHTLQGRGGSRGRGAVAHATAPPGAGVRFPIQSHRFSNGLLLLLCPLTRIPAIAASAVVMAGGREDPEGMAGLGHLVGNMLEEGTCGASHEEIAAYFDDVGGTVDCYGSREASAVTAKTLREDFPGALRHVKEMVFHSVFPEARIELCRSQVLTRIAAMEDRPDAMGAREFNRLVYAGTPLSAPLLGCRESVGRIGREDIRSFHSRHFTPSNTLLAVVGDMDPDEVFRAVEEGWAGVPAGDALVREPLSIRRPEGVVHSRLAAPDKEQLHVFLGHPGIRHCDPDYYTLLVMDVILGGGPGFTSRIPRKLRDEKGLAYHTYAGISGSAGLDEGVFLAYIGTAPENREEAIDGLLGEIRAIRKRRVTAFELESAKAYLTGSFVFKFETMGQIASFMLSAVIHELGFDYTEKFPRYIADVTAEGILDAARRRLDPDNYVLVEVGPTAGCEQRQK